MARIRTLFLTDSRTHNSDDTIFPMVRHMMGRQEVSYIDICDRSVAANKDFFHRPSTVERISVSRADTHYDYCKAGENEERLLRVNLTDYDAVFLALDQPITDEFLFDLENAFPDALFVNNPERALIMGAKDYLGIMQAQHPEFSFFMPKLAVCQSVMDVVKFQTRLGKGKKQNIVLKTIQGYGGDGVYRYGHCDDADIKTTRELQDFLRKNVMVLAMERLENKQQSDNRILVVDGEIIGVLERKAAKDAFLCNMSAGASVSLGEASKQEKEMVEAMAPMLRKNGLTFVGIDTLKDSKGMRVISEINTLNVGGLSVLDNLTGGNYVAVASDKILDRVMAQVKAKTPRDTGAYQPVHSYGAL